MNNQTYATIYQRNTKYDNEDFSLDDLITTNTDEKETVYYYYLRQVIKFEIQVRVFVLMTKL